MAEVAGADALASKGFGVPPLVTEVADERASDLSAATPARPLFGPESAFGFLHAGEVMDEPPLPWIIRGVLPRVGLTMLYADPKTGKSLIALDLAAVMIGGFRFMGEIQAEAVDYVVYMSGEGRSGMGGRLHGLTKAHPELDREELRERLVLSGKVVKLGAESGDLSVAEFNDWAGQLAATLRSRADGAPARIVFILDTWANAAQGIDSNDFQAVGDALNRLNELAQGARICVLVIHHSNKTGGFMGSQAFFASADLLFEAKKTDTGGTLSLIGGKDSGSFTPRTYTISVEDVTYRDQHAKEHTASAAWIKWTGIAERTKPLNKTEIALEAMIAYLRANDHRTADTGIRQAALTKTLKEDGISDGTLRLAIKKAKEDKDQRFAYGFTVRADEANGMGRAQVSTLFSPFHGEGAE